MRTRVGYAGGSTADPTYENIGDHAEAFQVDYDPEKISYEELLDIFWRNHNPSSGSWSTQYRSAVFFADEEQRSIAEASAEMLRASGTTVRTPIEPLERFYLAEGYHQKYYLRQDRVLMGEFKSFYPDDEGFVNSPAAAKVNGFLAGIGSQEFVKRFLPLMGLSEEGERRILTRAR